MASPARCLKKILLTRPLEDALRVKEDFQDLGFHVLLCPLLTIVYRKLPQTIPSFETVCLTSRHAIPALDTLDLKKHTPLYCVGENTATFLTKKGHTKVHWAKTGQDLLSLLTSSVNKTIPLLYLTGTVTSFPLAEKLKELGYNFHEIITYDASPPSSFPPSTLKAFEEERIDYVLFYSKRTAEIFGELIQKTSVNLSKVMAIAISFQTATALANLRLKRVIEAQDPSHQGILKCLKEQ